MFGTRYWPVRDLWLVLKPWPSILTELGGVLYADHVRFDPCHPYNYRASTNALITQGTVQEGSSRRLRTKLVNACKYDLFSLQ